MREQFPDFSVSDEITEQGWYFLPEVEPYSHRFYRANYVIETLAHQFGESHQKIALVSHGGFHNHLTSAIMKMTRQPDLWMEIENTGISSFGLGRTHETEQPRWRIDYLNRHEWLWGKNLTRDWQVYS
jgi:broad specificity phosphatase PhoE